MSLLPSSESTPTSHNYAQTNLQLFDQLRREGYSSLELKCIFNAYHLATKLFTGWFRSSGKTFLAHVVGTASILSSRHVPANLVAAGLLHAAYSSSSNLGVNKKKEISAEQRQQLLQVVGSEVEEYVARYTKIKWNADTIPIIRESLDSFDPIDRDVLSIRLANELEEHLDLGLLYCTNTKQNNYSNHNTQLVVEIAEKLGFSSLGNELATAQREIALAEIPIELSNREPDRNGKKGSYLLKPSYLKCHFQSDV